MKWYLWNIREKVFSYAINWKQFLFFRNFNAEEKLFLEISTQFMNLHVPYSPNRCDHCNFFYPRIFPKLKKNWSSSCLVTPNSVLTNFPHFCPSTARPFIRKASCFEILSGKSHVPLKFPHGFEQVLFQKKKFTRKYYVLTNLG